MSPAVDARLCRPTALAMSSFDGSAWDSVLTLHDRSSAAPKVFSGALVVTRDSSGWCVPFVLRIRLARGLPMRPERDEFSASMTVLGVRRTRVGTRIRPRTSSTEVFEPRPPDVDGQGLGLRAPAPHAYQRPTLTAWHDVCLLDFGPMRLPAAGRDSSTARLRAPVSPHHVALVACETRPPVMTGVSRDSGAVPFIRGWHALDELRRPQSTEGSYCRTPGASIDLDSGDAPRNPAGVLDRDLIARRVVAERDRETPPRARDAGIEMQHRAPQPEPEEPLDPGPVHPAGRARIPRPSTTADVRVLYGSTLYRWTPARVLARLFGIKIEKSSFALSPSPSAAKAITDQMAAWVYWPPISRTRGDTSLRPTHAVRGRP